MKKLIGMLAAVVAATLILGCGSTKSASATVLNKKEVSFKSEPGSLSISNETSKDVVVFVGKVEKNAVLGGITANQTRSFNLSKLQGIPESGSLLIRVATFETYKGKAIVTEDDVVFSDLVVYDLKNTSDSISLQIYKGVDSSHKYCIYLSNKSENFVLQVKEGTASQGPVVATLAPGQEFKKIYLDRKPDGLPYKFYPQFIYVNPKTNEITPVNVPGKEDAQWMDPDPDDGSVLTPVTFYEPNKNNLSYNVAFVTLRNDTKAGLMFKSANTIMKNDRGRRFTPSGRADVYQVDAERPNGSTYTQLSCEFNGATETVIQPFTFKPGYKYEIIATGMNGTYEYDIREIGQKSLVEDARIQLFNE